ncbi:MAG: putative aminohydrolase SsnA [Anaerolineales bacterium]
MPQTVGLLIIDWYLMLIHNSTVVTWGAANAVLPGHAVYIDRGLIKDLGPDSRLLKKYPHEKKMDAASQLLMPGNICAHTHFYGAFARGLAIPGPAPKDFPEILKRLWWPLDKALDEDSVRISALIHLVDAIRNGTTTLIDHHASPNFIDGSLEVIADAVQQSGLRAVLCYEVTDRDGEAKTQAGIRENVRFIERVGRERPTKLAAAFGLHASLTLSEATLDKCRAALPADAGFHIHIAEHEADQEDSLAKSGLRVVPRLAKHGILGPRTIAAHAVHVDQAEIEKLAESGAWVTHQPRSNMNNGVGAASVEALLAAGVKVCLGNDGFSQDMWSEWKAAYLLHKVWHRDPRKMNGVEVAKIAAENNAGLASSFFPGARLGEISAGARADLILVDYQAPTPLSADNLPWHILFGFEHKMVTTTMVNGEVLMRDRQLLTLDEAEVAAKARELAPQVWARYTQFVEAALNEEKTA